MPTAAVPIYVPAKLLETASPGLRFGMYLPLWGIDPRTKQLLWTTADVEYRVTGLEKRERAMTVDNKRSAMDFACKLNNSDQNVMRALAQRQRAISEPLITAGEMIAFEAVATAPFTTGLGNEHPLENGFAFLNPYGLPYLPGSGVKGALRQAARELISGDWGESGWSADERYPIKIGEVTIKLDVLDVLFGRESEEGEREHARGALSFWDVIPVIEGNRLVIDVMTPHQSKYYQGEQTPHESGLPNPINFLTIPPKSTFTFYIVCDRAHLHRLAPPLAEGERWTGLIEAAVAHAFEWLGFGAKNSVGYGAFERASTAAEISNGQRAGQTQTAAGGTQSRSRRQPAAPETVWEHARLTFSKQNGTLTATGPQHAQAYAHAPRGEELLATLPQDVAQKARSGQFIQVVAHVRGHDLVALSPHGGKQT